VERQLAAPGDKVYFAANNQNNVGVYEVSTGNLTTIPTTRDAAPGTTKYRGAAAVGDRLSLLSLHPSMTQDNIWFLQITTDLFSTINIAATVTGYKHGRAVTVGDKVVCVSFTPNDVGVVNIQAIST
jgi:hypothetical protein